MGPGQFGHGFETASVHVRKGGNRRCDNLWFLFVLLHGSGNVPAATLERPKSRQRV